MKINEVEMGIKLMNSDNEIIFVMLSQLILFNFSSLVPRVTQARMLECEISYGLDILINISKLIQPVAID